MPGRCREDELNLEVMDCISELVKRATALGQEIAQLLGLSVSDLIGLHKLEEPLTMKELGQRLHCDPSFVTMIANGLERHGLAKRETCEHDRRIKTVTLTAEGAAMKERLEQEFATRIPWAQTLDVDERQCLLRIARKMLGHAEPEPSDAPQSDNPQSDNPQSDNPQSDNPLAQTRPTGRGQTGPGQRDQVQTTADKPAALGGERAHF